MSSDDTGAKLAKALQDDKDALGSLLESYRPYVRLLAMRALDPVLNARLSASDVVQQTFLEASRDLASFRGSSEAQFLGWLRQILLHNVAHATQTNVVTQKRTVRKEQSLDRAAPERIRERLPSRISSPSSRAMRGELAVRLAQAMDTLPAAQYEAIRLRYLEGCTLDQIAGRMRRSEVAAAGLIKRGLRGLKDRLSRWN